MKKVFLFSTVLFGMFLAGNTSVDAASIESADKMPDISQEKVMVGYYQNWASYGDGYKGGTAKSMNLTDINKDYNVIDVAFMTGDALPTFKPYNMSDAEFKQQVAELNEQGRAVLISLGGANAQISLHKGQEQELADRIIELVKTYGFDGLDIDLEQNAIIADDNQTVIPDALKIVKDHYKKEGKNFIITMAPEFPYLRNGGAYESYITQLEDYYDFIAPQLYNQNGDGISGSNGWVAQNDDAKKYEFLSSMTDALANGTNGFVKIPAEKLALGLPANIDGAANGFVKNPKDVYRTFETMANTGHELKGIMTWSVNWDEGVDKDGKSYNGQFAKDYRDLIHGTTGEKPELPEKDTEAPTVPTTIKKTNITKSSIAFTWTASTDNVKVDHYNIYRNDKLVGTSRSTDFSDTDLKDNTSYSYQVSAVDAAGNESAKSKTTTFKTLEDIKDTEKPTTVTNVKASDITNTGLTLNWKAASDNVGVDHYVVYRDGKELKTVTGTSLKEANLTKDTTYNYQITAVDAAGNESAKSDKLSVTTTNEEVSTDSWDASAIYNEGDTVTYQGNTYKAKWWTQGDKPNSSDVWVLVDGSDEWSKDKAYQGGAIVEYDGHTYQAKWWTQGDKPDSSDVWVLQDK